MLILLDTISFIGIFWIAVSLLIGFYSNFYSYLMHFYPFPLLNPFPLSCYFSLLPTAFSNVSDLLNSCFFTTEILPVAHISLTFWDLSSFSLLILLLSIAFYRLRNNEWITLLGFLNRYRDTGKKPSVGLLGLSKRCPHIELCVLKT